jgi:CHAT domain-containing protein
MDYVISSYTPTVSSLTRRVKSHSSADVGNSGIFLTNQPNAPHATKLPGTTTEVSRIHTKLCERGARTLMIEGGGVSPEECLKYMEEFSCIHLACHASQHATDPLQSRFLFHSGVLDLATIVRRNLKNADLAFLSACQTSAGEQTLSDEVVHLAAGMLAAGYCRVVATMWAIGDRHAPDVASDFYEYLWTHREDGAPNRLDGTRSAEALHSAIQKLRERLGDDSEKSLLSWVPYVHFGY